MLSLQFILYTFERRQDVLLSNLVDFLFGFSSSYTRKVKMHIHSHNEVRRIYNVIGTIRGEVEPGKVICFQCNVSIQWPLHALHSYKGKMRNIVVSEILLYMIIGVEIFIAPGFLWFRVHQHFHCKCRFSRESHNQDRNICLQTSNFATERILSGYSSLLNQVWILHSIWRLHIHHYWFFVYLTVTCNQCDYTL